MVWCRQVAQQVASRAAADYGPASPSAVSSPTHAATSSVVTTGTACTLVDIHIDIDIFGFIVYK
eukprot:COSAG02_NODE_4509_length_5280_cov_2.005790_7_plen_64_part_00